MDFLEMYHVDLLICSNSINTASGLYKIFIQIFAVIAEFERDTLTERIVDNMMELAKDGRWLGGNTPMGFTVRRVTTGSGKGKSAYSYLESLPEEKCMVQRLYEIFRTTRSIQTTAKQMNEEGFHTPSGATFNASTTRLVLRNPIYCTADKRSYDYFIDHDGNVFGDMIEFDGTHGLSAYNKTDQEKYEGSDSTFISPKYVQTIESKPVCEWIIAVGRHEGFISSEQWIEVQELLDAIAEKYNRPHRKTNALLAGLVHCPHCGRRLSVISESDRWTNGKPRFKYVCPGYRKKECNFKAVDGVLLDEFVVQQLSELSDENSERFRRILEIKIEEVLEQSQTVQEHNLIKKKCDKLKADIATQTRNLREADSSIKQFIQEDLQNLAEELREAERQLSKLDEGRKNNMIAIRDLEMTKERLLSFAEYAKDAQPEVLVTLIQTIVERIYIVDKDDERFCHIFIKGCSGENYTGFFRTAGYIEQKTTPVCDSEQHAFSKIDNSYSISKIRLSGDDEQPLSTVKEDSKYFSYLSVYKNKLYFTELYEPDKSNIKGKYYCMDLNGRNKKVAINKPVYYPYIINDKIYYQDDNDYCRIHVCNLDGTNDKVFINEWVYQFIFDGTNFYYVTYKNKELKDSDIRNNTGSEPKRIVKSCDIEGKNNKIVIDFTHVSEIAMNKNTLYYTDSKDNYRLYSYTLSNEAIDLISNDNNISCISLTDNLLSYYDYDNKGEYIDHIYYCNLDGTNKSEIFNHDSQ